MEYKHSGNHGSHLGHWFHIGHALWSSEKYGVWPALILIVAGFFLAPMLIGIPMIIAGILKFIKACS